MSAYKLYQKVTPWPCGHWLFTQIICFKAPYFKTMRPKMVSMKSGEATVFLKKRRRVHNHIQTVHVIAICNALEMAMGMVVEATIPNHLRWLPQSMNVAYPAKSNSDISAVARVDPSAFIPNQSVPVEVKAYRADGTVVVDGVISVWVTEKPKKT